MASGVYEIKNNQNGKSYVGCSIELERRFYDHRKSLRYGRHENSHLQNSYNKHGKGAFEFRVICYCDFEYALILEQQLLELDPEYNIVKVARNRGPGICRQLPGAQGELHGQAKLSNNDIKRIKSLSKDFGFLQHAIAYLFNIDQGYVSAVLAGKRRIYG